MFDPSHSTKRSLVAVFIIHGDGFAAERKHMVVENSKLFKLLARLSSALL